MKFKYLYTDLKATYNDVCYIMSYFKKVKSGQKYLLLRIINTAIEAVFPLIYITVPGMIINELTGNRNINILLFYVGIVSFAPLINHIKELTLGMYITKLSHRIVRSFEVDYYSYIADMEYSCLENPNISVQINRILQNAPSAPIDIFNSLMDFFRALVKITSIFVIVSSLNGFVIMFLLLIVIINYIVNKKVSKIIYDYGIVRSKKDNILWNEFDNLSNPANGKEIRLYDSKGFFINRYLTCGNEIDNLALKKEKRITILRTCVVLTGMAQQILLYLFPIYQVLFSNLAVGTMTIFMSAGNQFANSLNEISSVYLNIKKYCLYIKEIKDFRRMPSQENGGGTEIPYFDRDSTIEFKNVSFRYPGSKTYAIKDLNIKISFNQKLCIVGENGSGKSTFINLITGLYLPTEGEILLNGVDIKEFDRMSYMKLFAPVFQDYRKYSLSLALNVSLEEEYDKSKVVSSINKSGLSCLIEKLSNGYDTYVGKRVDESGFEPSGGEGQKIAISRALYHDRPIYLLDEPTAALDPVAEYDIYSTFSRMIDGRTAILVTHRMSAVQLADRIAVFSNGHVAEYGTHAELYAKGGIYTEMFDKQAQFYRDVTREREN